MDIIELSAESASKEVSAGSPKISISSETSDQQTAGLFPCRPVPGRTSGQHPREAALTASLPGNGVSIYHGVAENAD
jgi:hypothetical protein